MRRKILLGARLLLVSVLAIAWFAPPAQAEVLSVSGPTDFWFEIPEPTNFQVRAYAIENGIDSHLWLYGAEGNLIAANDDWFGLDSWLDIPLQPGSYRLRAGVCCGNPDAWYGDSYTIDINVSPIPAPTTTLVEETTTTTQVEETTTTTVIEETTTTTEVPVTEPPVTEPPETTTEAPTTTIETSLPPIQEEPIWQPITESTPPTTTPTTTAPETTAPATTAPPSTETLTSSSPPLTEPAATNAVTQAPATAPIATPPAEPVAPEQPPIVVPPEVTTTTTVVTTSATTVPSFDTAPSEDAPLEVRQAFEQSVDLFSGEFDDYVPIGSTITVAQRRVVIAATAVMFLLPTPTSRRKI